MRRRDNVYSAYWHLAAERHAIYERRLAGEGPPWTSDPILARFRFTNPWRATDRVSQFLIRDVIYSGEEMTARDLFARIVLFRLFSKPDTWRSVEHRLGPVRAATIFDPALAVLLDELRASGPIYTNAFILCATKAYGFDRKHLNHLALVKDMLGPTALPRTIEFGNSLKDVFDALLTYPLIGPFMAYQLAIDLNYSPLLDFSENEFTVPGPGAERGIRKVFPDARRADMSTIIQDMVAAQDEELESIGRAPLRLAGHRPLHAIDCQNLFCELDKYSRVKFPALLSNRTQIKATFKPSSEPLPPPFYPPKWNVPTHLSSGTPSSSPV